MFLTGYQILLLFLLFAGLTPFLLMTVSEIVQIKYPSPLKYTTYESGMTPFGTSHVQFDVKFYMYALLFILFDIETVFLFPWAVSFDNLVRAMGLFPILEMLLFIGVLVIGLVYAWRRDALRWQ
jgi:NADH:ubiquinone oxidoreductase subunit 3 (subunit A)